MIGTRLLHYEIVAPLGAGAMGTVYLARDTRTGRQVALKLVADQGAGLHPDTRERMLREAQASARLSHPGIVTLFTVEEDQGRLVLVSEYVEGETLARRLSRGPMGPQEVLRLARELSTALAHAHARGVLHRDLKPENVLVSTDGRYKIADFGIARLEGAPTLTEAGTLLGTLPYTAPERLRGHPGDARADLFALGAILYEALAGRRAFPGQTESEVLYQVVNETPPPLAVTGSAGPLAALIAQLLAKEPGERPSGAEVVSGIVEGLAPGTAALATAAPPAAPPTMPEETAPPRRPWRNPLILGVAAALLIAAGLWWARTRFVPAAEAGPPAVAVLYFDNVVDPADPDRMGPVAGNLLVTSLAQDARVNVLSTQRILEALRRLGRDMASVDKSAALEIARRARATRIVTGSIVQTSPTLVMTAEVADVASGRVLLAERIEGRPGETVFQVVDALGARLLGRLAGDESVRLAPVAQRASADLEAVRRYTEGLEEFAAGRTDSAEARFHEALRRDPQFAQAHYQLAIVEWWNYEPAGAAESIARARALSARLSPLEREMVEGLASLVTYAYDGAERHFARLAREHPGESLVQYGLMEAAFHAGNKPVAIQAARAVLALDPDMGPTYLHLIQALLETRQMAEADRVSAEAYRRNPDSPSFREQRYLALLSLGRPADAFAPTTRGSYPSIAHRLVQLGRDSVPASVVPKWVEATPAPLRVHTELVDRYVVALQHGRFREALAISDRAWAVFRKPGGLPIEIPPANGLDAAYEAGDRAKTLAITDSMVARLRGRSGEIGKLRLEMYRAAADARLGDVEGAERRLQLLERQPLASDPGARPYLRYVRAALLGARGRPREALAELDASWFVGWEMVGPATMRFERARLLMAESRFREAFFELDTVVAVPLLMPNLAVRARFLRAQALERLGRGAEAAAGYRAFLRIWNGADPNVREVPEAKAALARLQRAGQAAGGAR